MVAPGQWPISTSLRMTFVSITRAARAAGGSSSSDRLTRKLGRLSMGLWMPITLNASLSRCETAARVVMLRRVRCPRRASVTSGHQFPRRYQPSARVPDK